MPLWFGISAAISCVAALSVGLTFFLNFAKFDSTFSELERSRFNVLAQSVGQSVENGLGLGLALSELRNTQEIVDRLVAENDAVVSVSVFDARGATLFAAGAETPNSRAAMVVDLERHLAIDVDGADQPYWEGEDADAFGIGRPLINPFDQVVGGVYLRYGKANNVEVAEKAFRDLATVSAAVIALLALIVTPVVAYLVAIVTRRVRRMTAYAQAGLAPELVDAHAVGPIESPPADAPDPELARFVDEANAVNRIFVELEAELKTAERG
ncbi:MAG: hypothetical protein AAF360_09745 [Pseudomonadota bacterium]